MPRLNLCFASQHPSGEGHFAGNPIIPGALLLAQVWTAIHATGVPDIYAVKSAKFTHPLRPGEPYALEFEWTQTEIKFHCATAQHLVLSGVFKCLAPTIAD